jgi:mannose-1-phosphate guanylyltransferase
VRHAVILAGGSGTRLWPASRRARPKQLLALGASPEVMVAAAVELGRRVAADVAIVTAESQVAATRSAVPNVELIVEPVGRNTAAAIGLAAAILARKDPDASMVVLPADQHVGDRAGLAHVLEIALAAAEQADVIATVGIPPTRPETGFGYLELTAIAIPGAVQPIARFVEKPDLATAESYVASGRYLWNAGIFCARASRLLAELDRQLPETAKAVREIANDPASARARYQALPSVSIDHGVMEKAERVVTVPAAVGWDDVGSWAAIPAIRGTDSNGNTIVGSAVVVDGDNNVVISDDATLIATVGVSDLIVVKHGDAILVIPKSAAQDVRKVIDALSQRGLARYL